MSFTPAWRRLILLVHVVTSVGFLGAVAGFLALALVGLTTTDPVTTRAVYIANGIITSEVIVPLAWASLLIGILQSLGKPWGLFRYYWVIIKLVLTIIATAVLMLQTQTIGMAAQMALQGDIATVSTTRFGMVLHGAGGLLVLLVLTLLSVYKPRGLTPVGAKALAVRNA